MIRALLSLLSALFGLAAASRGPGACHANAGQAAGLTGGHPSRYPPPMAPQRAADGGLTAGLGFLCKLKGSYTPLR